MNKGSGKENPLSFIIWTSGTSWSFTPLRCYGTWFIRYVQCTFYSPPKYQLLTYTVKVNWVGPSQVKIPVLEPSNWTSAFTCKCMAIPFSVVQHLIVTLRRRVQWIHFSIVSSWSYDDWASFIVLHLATAKIYMLLLPQPVDSGDPLETNMPSESNNNLNTYLFLNIHILIYFVLIYIYWNNWGLFLCMLVSNVPRMGCRSGISVSDGASQYQMGLRWSMLRSPMSCWSGMMSVPDGSPIVFDWSLISLRWIFVQACRSSMGLLWVFDGSLMALR